MYKCNYVKWHSIFSEFYYKTMEKFSFFKAERKNFGKTPAFKSSEENYAKMPCIDILKYHVIFRYQKSLYVRIFLFYWKTFNPFCFISHTTIL